MKKLIVLLLTAVSLYGLATSFTPDAEDPGQESATNDRELITGAQIGQSKVARFDNMAGEMMVPASLPWPGSMIGGQQVIMQPGVALASCGTLVAVAAPDRYTIGLFNIENAVPASGRSNQTASTQVWHHPSWQIDSIGNIFGVTINTKTGDMFAAASANYGAGYLGQDAVVGYGIIGGGVNSVAAAGTVYRLDAVTGQASVFVQLPQQSSTFTMLDCESSDAATRTNTGVSLGNITYDEYHDQYFVSNIEDGRIYRISAAGAILDSYDPLSYDNGAPGIFQLDSLAYGIAVEPGGNRLFFGTPDDVADAFRFASPGAPRVYSIDLTSTGSFVGSIDNTFLPAGVPNNYVGTETFHVAIPTGSGFSYGSNYVYLISSLDFSLDGELIVGIRVSCNNSFFSSYNHYGETDLVAKNPTTSLYSGPITQFDVSVTGDAGPDDNYGGAGFYLKSDGVVRYIISSADILAEAGPHGLAVFDETFSGGPLMPLGAVSYGVVDNGDPKGVGGDVVALSNCSLGFDNLSVSSCAGGTYTLTGVVTYKTPPSGLVDIQVINNGVPVSIPIDITSSNSFSIPNLFCDGEQNLVVTANFVDDVSCMATTTYNETIMPSVALGDTAWIDSNANGSQDAGEPGLAGVTVMLLYPSGTMVDTNAYGGSISGMTTTDGNGYYVFESLAPDVYKVKFDTIYNYLGDEYLLTIPNVGSVPDTDDSDADPAMGGMTQTVSLLTDGQTDFSLDAGFFAPVSVGDTAWVDSDGNGIQDPGEPGLEGITVMLQDAAGNMITTDAYGNTISGMTVTDGNGYYLFDSLTPGIYKVKFDIAPTIMGEDYALTSANLGGDPTKDSDADASMNGMTAPTALIMSGESADTLDAGYFIPVSVGDTAWVDVDGNGMQDPGEPGLEGITVMLQDAAGNMITMDAYGNPITGITTTGASGFYQFDSLAPGVYKVKFDVDPNINGEDYILTQMNIGNPSEDSDADATMNGMTAPTNFIMSGEAVDSLDAGYFIPVIVGDTAWVDVDGDGIQDPGEPGLGGVMVMLQDAAGNMITMDAYGNPISGMTTTDASGFYEFGSLVPGVYKVKFEVDLNINGEDYILTQLNIGDPTMDSDADPAMNGMTAPTPYLMSGEAVDSLDAGYFIPVIVGDTAWVDNNGDGVQDPGEPGLEGVMVMLQDVAGNMITMDAYGNPISGMTTTDASGFYEFDSLVPGIYKVKFEVDPNINGEEYFLTQLNIGDPTMDSDADPSMNGMTYPTPFLLSGEVADTLDAGYYIPVIVGDTAWVDSDGDGVQDPGEPGLEGITVMLQDAAGNMITMDAYGNPITGMTTTDASGFYEFDSLAPGIYKVKFEVDPNINGEDYILTQLNIGDPTMDSDADPAMNGMTAPTSFLVSGDVVDSLDAGYYIPVIVGDTAWVDVDGDGMQDPGEPGLEGITVMLQDVAGNMITMDAYGNPITGMTTTDASGFYQFDSLAPGAYKVKFDVDPNINGEEYILTQLNIADPTMDSDADPSMNGMTAPTPYLMSGETVDSLDAGYFIPVIVGDTAWVDVDGDGIQDPGEPGLEGVTVMLQDASGNMITLDAYGNPITGMTTTDASGFYLFDSLSPGVYKVKFEMTPTILAEHYVLTLVNAGGDPGLDSDGDLTKNGMTAPTDYIMSGEVVDTLDAGYFIPVSVGDTAWVDLNGDGLQDPGEPGLEGVTVMLQDAMGNMITQDAYGNPIAGITTTDANGFYLFDSLTPGVYKVKFSATPNISGEDYVLTQVNTGGDPGLDSDGDLSMNGMTLPTQLILSGEMVDTLDAGYFIPVSVGDIAWVDINGDGIQDPDEPGLEGITVMLQDAAGNMITEDAYGNPISGMTTTAQDGTYLFDSLPPGVYKVKFDVSINDGNYEYVITTANVGNDPNSDSDGQISMGGMTEPIGFIMSGESVDSLDAGYFDPVAVGDTAWVDINENGLQDPGEVGLEGVKVILLDPITNTMITQNAYEQPISGMTFTDVNGHYLFDSLYPGNYCVQFDVTTANTGDGNAANWQITYQDVNNNGDEYNDSDADEVTGKTDSTGFLSSFEVYPDLDAGFFPPRFDLAVVCDIDTSYQDQLVNPDDTVTVMILVANQGNVKTKCYNLNTLIPSGMEFIDANKLPVLVQDSVIQWCDSLPDVVGLDSFAIDTFICQLWINPIDQGLRDFQFRIWSEISKDTAICYGISDEDSTPDDDSGYDDDDGPGMPPNDQFLDLTLIDMVYDSVPNDEDDNDFVDIFTRRFDLALTKALAPEEDNVVVPGDTVAYSLKVYNQGNDGGFVGIPADNINLIDYFPENLSLVVENGWMLSSDSTATRLLEAGDELPLDGLQPDSCVTVEIRFVMTHFISPYTTNFAEIIGATDTAGIAIIDFDSDLDSTNMDSTVDDAIDDNVVENTDGDGDGQIDEDDHDGATFITCLPLDCYARLSLSLGPDCMLEITPDMLLVQNAIATSVPELYKVTLEYGNGILIPDNILRAQHRGRKVKASITWIGPAGCSGGTCWTELEVKGTKEPFIEGTFSKTVYCVDPFLNLSPESTMYPQPIAYESCNGNGLAVEYVGDWTKVYDCVLGMQDTAKVIYREWAATSSDGIRKVAFDTIVVLRTPPMTILNTWCEMIDTVYCGTADRMGPYMILPDVCPEDGESECDTIYFLNADGSAALFASQCGLQVHVTQTPFGTDDCTSTTRYVVEIKQNCYGIEASDICSVGSTDIVINGSLGDELYAVCDFWLVEIDTVPPVVHCDLTHYEVVVGDTVYVATNGHECSAVFGIPPAIAVDSCRGVVSVKVQIPGYGSYVLERTDGLWQTNATVSISFAEGGSLVIYESYDACYNVNYDTCYVVVRDDTRPVAVSPKGLNIVISGKKQWIDAEEFDEGSWDNCELNLVLARRTDWQETCVDLCDSVYVVDISEHGDTLWGVHLETDATKAEVEAHYARQIAWWSLDGTACGDLLSRAWQYDLHKYASTLCGGLHNANSVEAWYLSKYGLDTTDAAMHIGGGWSDQVPFDCTDACGMVKVELLVMDYWCNWNTSWTEVWVEDRSTVQIGREVTETVEISCKSYKEGGLDELVSLAEAGDALALATLDSVFGGYEKAWLDPYGNYMDSEGNSIGETLAFNDIATCTCTTKVTQVKVWDDHLGYQWVDSISSDCYYTEQSKTLQQGVVRVNCASNVYCNQEVWSAFDACGQGVIYRKWKMTQACPVDPDHPTSFVPDTLTRIQTIYVGNHCELSKYMFRVPSDTIVDACGITYSSDNSGLLTGELDPSYTGEPVYEFDDDCRIVGIGHQDKVYKIVGGDAACYKVLRTWYFADWCSGSPANDYWWLDHSAIIDSCVQTIIVRDTVPPVCLIRGPVEEGGTIEAVGCTYNLMVEVDVTDACGIESYAYELRRGSEVIEYEEATTEAEMFTISMEALGDGDYQLRVRTVDGCQNEGFCIYMFSIKAVKKPSPVCLTSLTAELTGVDRNLDGEIDTAMAIIWAKEFNSSSQTACGSDTSELLFKVELLDGIDDETHEEDTTYIEVGCAHIGMQQVRMWVIDPSGTFDYCDVILMVEDNEDICSDVSNYVSVRGQLETESGVVISGAEIQLKQRDVHEVVVPADHEGSYGIETARGSQLTLRATKDGDDREGVSTADLILIQRHLLGRSKLTTMYREEAADVNEDGRISALDLVTIRKLILGVIEEYPESDSWRFYNRKNAAQTYELQQIEESLNLDWTGVKIGDVNEDYDPNQAMARHVEPLQFEMPEVQLEAGRRYRISVTSSNFDQIHGYQYTLEYDPRMINIVGIDYGDTLGLQDANFAIDENSKGLITTSWHALEKGREYVGGMSVDRDEVLYSLVIEGKEAGWLSEALTINSRQTEAEAYNQALEVKEVAFSFVKDRQVQEGFALYQNRPNPFQHSTVIGFYLPEAMDARLTIYDARGTLLKVINGSYSKGYQEEVVRQTDLNAHGLIYYQLDTKNFTATRKMILVH